MPPIEITDRARALATRKSNPDWSFVGAISEPDFRPSRGAGRIVQVFLDCSLIGRYPYLSKQIVQRSRGQVDPDDLEYGQLVICINRAKTILAIVTAGHNVIFHKTPTESRINMQSIANIPRAFNQGLPFDYDKLLSDFLHATLNGGGAPKPEVKGRGRGNTQAAMDIINASKQRTILRKNNEEKGE